MPEIVNNSDLVSVNLYSVAGASFREEILFSVPSRDYR